MNRGCDIIAEIRILVVEDEAIVAEDIRRTLNSMGYDVPLTVPSGEEAIKKVEEINPDLVLMDIILCGEIDGVEAARQVSSRFNTPVIYLTAHSDKATLERAKITGPFGYIIKPFKEKELKMAIEIALFKHEAEKALRQSEERYRSLVDNAKDVIFTLSTDRTITSLNPSFETTTGWSRSDWLGKTFPGIIHPDDLPLAMELLQHTLLGEVSPSSLELRVLSKSGVYVTMDFVVTPQVLDRKVVNILGIGRDVTERKRAEEALKVSEEKYRTLIENIQDGVFIIQDARIQFANEAFARIAGYTVEEITGKDFQELVAPEDLEMVTDRYRRRQTGEDIPKEYEFSMLHKDGTRIIVNMNVGLINYRSRVASMGTVKDITERKQAEDALRESEKRYQTLAELSPVGVFHNDAQGRCVYVNDRLCEITGLTPEQLYGLTWLKALHPEDRDRILDEWSDAQKKKIPFHSEYRFQRPDGVATWVIGQAVAEMGNGGEILGYVGTVTDITERKRAEEALRFKEKHFRLLIENASDIITILNADGTISYVSPSIERVLGYQPEELIGKIAFELIHPDDMGKVMDVFNDTIQNPGITRSAELHYMHKDGSWRIIESAGKSILNDTGANELVINSRDITERKRAEEALKESEDRYRRLVDFSTIGIAIHCDRKIVYANPAAMKIFGATKPEELIGKPVLQFIHPDYHEIIQERIGKQKHGETAPLMEEKFLRLDGTSVDVEIVSIPFTYMGKQAMYGIFQEITERKRAEEEIQRRAQIQASLNKLLQISLENISLEEILKKVIDHLTSIPWLALESVGGIWMADDDSDVLVLKAQRGLPESLQTVCARVPFGRCICGQAASSGKIEFATNIDEHHENIYQGITPHGHYCVPLVSSGRVIGIINLYLKEGHCRDEKEEDFLHAIADVLVGMIQRKQVEEALKRSSEFSSTVLDSMNDALCIINANDFSIVGANSVFLRELGLSEEDVIGRTCFETTHHRTDPCKPPNDICPLLETVNTGKHSIVEHLHYGKDGKKIYVEVSTSPILDEKERITQVVHVSRDITERKQAEERLKQANIELKKADKLKTQFLSIVSHELRTPITPMNAQLQMILAGFFGEITEKQKMSLDMILRNTRRLDRLIGDVLDISKLESGVMKFNMTKASLNEIVENAVETMKIQAWDKSQKLTLKDDKIPEVTVDKDRITQVVVNLLNNAIKFTDAGGTIEVELSGNTDHARVAVRDNGIGIKKEDQVRLFTPFQQVDSSESRKYEGSGLGLAICKKIITYHGGSIGIDSEPGKGSTFYFTIPYNYQIKEEKVDSSLFEKIMLNEA